MKVLVIDDHPDILALMKVILEEAQFEVDTAPNANDGLALLREEYYDALVLDLMLPDRSGLDVICALRSLKIQVPILVLSARGGVEDKIRALDLGADDYLVKGFAAAEFLSRIKSLIRRSRGIAKNVMTCGNLVVNLTDMSARRKGQVINLTKKEFTLLQVLIWNKNRVASIEQLVQSAWGDVVVSEYINKLNVHIRGLRKKVDKPFEKRLIHTVRGFGYQLTCEENS